MGDYEEITEEYGFRSDVNDYYSRSDEGDGSEKAEEPDTDVEEELRDAEVDEILGNDWAYGEAVTDDATDFYTGMGAKRRRSRRGLHNGEFKGVIRHEVREADKEVSAERKPEAEKEAETWKKQGAEKEPGIGKETGREENAKGHEKAEKWGKQEDTDPYRKWAETEIRASDLKEIAKNRGDPKYDSREDKAVKNGQYEGEGDSFEDIERLDNFRSHQGMYDFYAYVGGRVTSKSADNVKRQEGTVSEGLRELRDHKIVQFVRTMGTGYGASSVYRSMKYRDERVKEVAGRLNKLKVSPEVIKDSGRLKAVLKENGIRGVARHDILRYRKEYMKRLEIKTLLQSDVSIHKGGYSREDRRYIASEEFLAGRNPDRYAGVLMKYFRQNGYAIAGGNTIQNVGYRDLEKIFHHADNYGFHNSMDKKMLSELIRVKKEKYFRARAGKSLPGRIIGFTGMNLVSADPYLREISSRVSRGYAALRLKKEMTARICRVIGIEARQSFLRRSRDAIHSHIIEPTITNVIKPVIRKAGTGTVHAIRGIGTVGRSVRRVIEETKPGKVYSTGRNAIRGYIRNRTAAVRNIGNRLARTSPVRFTKKVGLKAAGGVKAGVRTGRKAAGYAVRGAKGGLAVVSRAGYILGTPFRLVGRFGSFLWQMRVKTLMLAGGITVGVVGFLLLVFTKVLVLQLIVAILSFDLDGLVKTVSAEVLEVYENYIEYSDYKDMREDLQTLKGYSESTWESAEEIGKGIPQNDRVYEEHRIEQYGSPDKEKGYTIHFLDSHGNELPSRTNNVRDVEALCAAMIGNQMGEYASYSRDLAAFDVLLKDMYELMVPELKYEESEIYTCLYGCESYSYHCNDPADYDRAYEMAAAGVGFYEDLIEYNPGGCAYSEAEGEYYCTGHRVSVCFGHKDVDIYITLFDVEYAIAHNLYPDNWESRPYAEMVREFVEHGAWQSEFYPKIARNFLNPDWYEAYGYDPEGGTGFSTHSELTEEQIQEILKRFDGDISKAREEILAFALGSVGKIPYYWGGKADVWGYDGNDFGTPVKPDRKGRDRKGLDCSGFVQWVYGSALGVTIPGSTAAYSGYSSESYGELKIGDLGFLNPPGAESNHVGIYAGKDASGNDLWVHCSSSKGSTYGTYGFKYYYNVLN